MLGPNKSTAQGRLWRNILKIYDVNLFVCRSHFKTGHISTNPEDPDFFPNQNLPLGTSTVKISKKSPTIVEKSAKTYINNQSSEEIQTPEVYEDLLCSKAIISPKELMKIDGIDDTSEENTNLGDGDYNTGFAEPAAKRRKILSAISEKTENTDCGGNFGCEILVAKVFAYLVNFNAVTQNLFSKFFNNHDEISVKSNITCLGISFQKVINYGFPLG